MKNCKVVKIVNASLSEEEWQGAFRRLRLYSRHFFMSGDTIYHPVTYSTQKTGYSNDAGGSTTEYNAFRVALDFWLGERGTGVRIVEIEQ